LLELFLIAAYVLPLIGVANFADGRKRLYPFLAILTFGFVNVSGLWRWCAAAVRRLSVAGAPAFDPDKPVHRTAAFLLILGFLMLLGINLTNEIASDGEGFVIALPDAMLLLLGTGALHLAAAFLGVGWAMRRRLPDVLRRLCLQMPTPWEAGISLTVGVGLWMLSTGAAAVWELTAPVDVFQEQTELARQYFQVFSGSPAAALMLAVVPAVSEEIFFRGALQPVFGVFLTSLFFSVGHLQYGLTPALLILFAVSLGFSWLRLRFCTSAAIIAHAVYNLLPFVTG